MQNETLKYQSRTIRSLFDCSPWVGIVTLLAAILMGIVTAWLPLDIATVLILGIVVAVVTFVQPLLGLGLALLAGPLGALEQLLSGIVSVDSGQILLLLTLFSWMVRNLARKHFEIPKTLLNVPLLLFIIVAFVSLIGANSLTAGAKELSKWVEIAAIIWMVVDLARPVSKKASRDHGPNMRGRPAKVLWIVSMLLIAGLSQAVIGIWQFGLRGDGPEHFIILERFYRAYGTFEQPNPFGGYMNLGVLLAIGTLVGLLAAWLSHARKHLINPAQESIAFLGWRFYWKTLWVAVAAVIMGSALLFSWSRGAWLGFVAGLMVMFFYLPRKRTRGAILVGLIAAVVFLAYRTGFLPGVVSSRLTSFAEDFSIGDVRGADINDENYSVIERQAHWQAGLNMLRDNLLLGVGFGNYGEDYGDYALINWPDALGHAHNYYVNLLAEVGVLGLAFYLLFWVAVIWQTVRLLRILAWPGRGIALGLLASWIALAAHHLVDKLYVNNIYIHLGVMLGLLQLLDLYPDEVGRYRSDSFSDFGRKSDFWRG